MTVTTILLCMSAIATGTATAGESLEYRYWKALNQGRDVSELTEVLEQLAFPRLRSRSVESLRSDAATILDRIEATATTASVTLGTTDGIVKSGNDWPSMGGGITHRGETSDPGPVAGREAWRYPVGWFWEASPRIEGDEVFTASPALEHPLLCLDRKTGKRIWSADTPVTGVHRHTRAASPVIPLDERYMAVYRETYEGWPFQFLVARRDNGQIVRRLPALMQETKQEPPEPKPKQLVAFRFHSGTQVIVKSLETGRTWWRFPTGYLSDGPLLAWGFVFAAAEDGTLWALNLWGDQRVAWTYQNPSGWGSTPTEQKGVLYVGGNDGAVYAFNMQTGSLRWKTRVAEDVMPHARRFFSTPKVVADRVYLGAADGGLYSLDAATGQLRWKHDCGDWIRSRPTVSNNVVCAATLDGKLVAVRDEQTRATPLWTAVSGRFSISADLESDRQGVLASTSDFDLVAYDWRDGHEQWRVSLIDCSRDGELKVFADSMPEIMQAPVIVAEGIVLFAGRNGFVTAADATTGRRRWRFESGGRIAAAPTTRNGRVFVGQKGGNRKFYALDLKTGEPVWSRDLGEVWASPECDDRDLYVGNMDTTLYCLDPENGQTRWKRAFAAGVYPAPALDGERVYTGSWDGHYYALDRNDGHIVWAYSRPGRPYHVGGRPDSAAPILADGKVFVPVLGGRFIALDARNGKLLWEWRGTPWRICNVTGATDGTTVFVSQFGNAYEFPFGMNLVGLDIKTGKEQWRLPDVGGLTAPAITGDRFVIGSMGRPFLSGYQLSADPEKAPRLLWRLKTGGVMYESLPAVSGRLAYFLSNDGWLRAIK